MNIPLQEQQCRQLSPVPERHTATKNGNSYMEGMGIGGGVGLDVDTLMRTKTNQFKMYNTNEYTSSANTMSTGVSHVEDI